MIRIGSSGTNDRSPIDKSTIGVNLSHRRPNMNFRYKLAATCVPEVPPQTKVGRASTSHLDDLAEILIDLKNGSYPMLETRGAKEPKDYSCLLV